MGETNNLIQQFFSDNERFADLINIYVGKDLLNASDLTEKDSQSTAKVGKNPNAKTFIKHRDIIRKVAIGMDFILIGIENQTEIDYAIPIRTMVYDAMSYDEQRRNIMKQNKQQKKLSGTEFTGGFLKHDRVIPVFTLVLHYGREDWHGSLDLHGIMNFGHLPREVKRLIHNYPINLLHVRDFEDAERFKTDLRVVFGFLQNSSTKENIMHYIHKNQQDFEELHEDAYDVIAQLTNSKELVKYKDKQKENGRYNMCQAIKEMIEDGINQGFIDGEIKGETRILRLAAAMAKDNCTDQIARLANDRHFLQEMLVKYNIV